MVEKTDAPVYREALEGPDSKHWLEAIDKEYKSFEAMGTWEVVKELPEGQVPIGTKWVLKLKTNIEGKKKFKARLVVQGCT